jgi:hypothetical protein
MALVPVATRNRINPMAVSTIEQFGVPYGTYNQVELCTDPNCSVCRGKGRGRHHKYHKRHHHHHRHHRKHKTNFWNSLLPRGESASSIVSVQSVELDERRPYYNTQVTERALVPVNQTERQVVSTTRTERFADDDLVREAWVSDYFFFEINFLFLQINSDQ